MDDSEINAAIVNQINERVPEAKEALDHAFKDMVDHPAHYGGADNPYEAIKVIDAWQLDFSLGNAVKYIARARHKGSELEDLKKAAWYLNHRIEKLSGAFDLCNEHGCVKKLCDGQYHANGKTRHEVIK